MNSEGLEYVDNLLKFRWKYENDLKQEDFYGYFSSGEIKYIGFFIDNRFCYLIELNMHGDAINIDKFFKYDVKELNKEDREFSIKFNLGKKVTQKDSLKVLYALYKISGSDTTKITKQRLESIKSNSKQIDILFHLNNTGLYYFKIAIPTIENMKESYIIYDLLFYLNDSSILKFENGNDERLLFITRL